MPTALCTECRKAFKASARHQPRFCGKSCKSTFNNRRMKRGTTLYDLLMVGEETGKHAELARRIPALLAEWRSEDVGAGRVQTTKRASELNTDTLYLSFIVRSSEAR